MERKPKLNFHLMSVEDKNVIDFISLDREEKEVMLTISDHLEWDDENEHLLILRDKLNSYLAAIEGGDLYIKYPKALNKNICIRISSATFSKCRRINLLAKIKTSNRKCWV